MHVIVGGMLDTSALACRTCWTNQASHGQSCYQCHAQASPKGCSYLRRWVRLRSQCRSKPAPAVFSQSCFVDQQHLPDCDVEVQQLLWDLAVHRLLYVTGQP